MSSPIYLDNHATTPCDPRVLEAMLPFFTERFGNSASSHHVGTDAAAAVDVARNQVAALINAQPTEVIFTSGATESNNLAIIGAAHQHEHIGGKRRRLVTTAIEHKAVLGPCQRLAQYGWEVIILPVDQHGIVCYDLAAAAITDDTLLVSIQAANSEIGTLQPVLKIAHLAHEHGALLHCDAAQAIGKVPVDVHLWDVDLLSLSGHKFYGPKGIGALWVRGGPRRLRLQPLMSGGGQEDALRPGTLPVPLVVGLGAASALCHDLLSVELSQIALLRDTLEQNLLAVIPGLRRNGHPTQRLPNNSSLTFPDLDAEVLLGHLPELAVSTGSACDSGSIEPSRVLTSIGLSAQEAFNTLRFGLSRFTTPAEIETATQIIITIYNRLVGLL